MCVCLWGEGGGRRGCGLVLFIMAYIKREALSERGTFFRPQEYVGVGVSLVEVYERVKNTVISVGKKAKKG